MSRTFRNRHSVPKGWVVRDDGLIYNTDHCECTQVRETRWRRGERCACQNYPLVEFRRHVYRKESKSYRKAWYHEYRVKVKDRMRHGESESLPRLRRTCGYLTW